MLSTGLLSGRLSRLVLRPVCVLLVGALGLAAEQSESLFQYSTLEALSAGQYRGSLTIAELKTHGDFGVGTFDELDGEMVVLDGHVYQVRHDGSVVEPKGEMTTPFATVMRFASQKRVEVAGAVSSRELTERLYSLLSSDKRFHAIKVTGVFRTLTARSVPKQAQGTLLANAIEQQTTFPMRDVRGTLVGIYTPTVAKNLSQAGFHFHFVTDDRKAGGHAVEFEMTKGVIEIREVREVDLVLP